MRRERDRPDRLILIGFGTLEHRGGRYYGKNSVVDYIHEMSVPFERTVFVCQVERGQQCFSTQLSDGIEVIPISLNTRRGKPHLLTAFMKDQLQLLKQVNRHTAVMMSSPLIWFTPIAPLLHARSFYYGVHMGCNPGGVARLLSIEGGRMGRVKGMITRLFGALSCTFSDAIFVCGNLDPYRTCGEKVKVSQPITRLTCVPQQTAVAMTGAVKGSEGVNILYVGGLYYNKGIDKLIWATKHLLELDELRSKRIHLTIVGDGRERGRLEELVEGLDMIRRVTFTGWIDDPIRLSSEYSRASIFVLPSIVTEGSPRVIDEAMSYSLPVIATDMDYGSFYRKGEEIILVPPGEVDELTQALRALILDRALYERLSINGRKRAESIMALGTAASQHLSAIFRTGDEGVGTRGR